MAKKAKINIVGFEFELLEFQINTLLDILREMQKANEFRKINIEK